MGDGNTDIGIFGRSSKMPSTFKDGDLGTATPSSFGCPLPSTSRCVTYRIRPPSARINRSFATMRPPVILRKPLARAYSKS